MWTHEVTRETALPAAAIWARWADVPGWPAWNADIERIELDGEFAAGGRIVMTPQGQEPVELRLADVVVDERFVDEARAGDTVIRTTHALEPLADGRLRVVYRLQISGPEADSVGPQLGPAISADFGDVIDALLAHATA